MALTDADDVFAYAADPEVLRYTTGNTPERVEQTHAWLRAALADPETHMWAICLAEHPTVIGALEFGVPRPGVGSIHYALGRSHWGVGLMTEAVDVVCRWAMEWSRALREITTSVAAANIGSARVLEKCGFERIGSAFDSWDKFAEPVELYVYRRNRGAVTGRPAEGQ
jgi:ribosomal-protein-alanine N-acetyltransferase